MRRLTVVSALLLPLAAACSSSTAASGPTDATSADRTSGDSGGGVCAPGQSIACVGPGGCSGGQVCRSDGSGYAACDCGGGPDGGQTDAAQTDAPAQTDASGDASVQHKAPTMCESAGGGTLASANYRLTLYLAPATPLGTIPSANYRLTLGPAAAR